MVRQFQAQGPLGVQTVSRGYQTRFHGHQTGNDQRKQKGAHRGTWAEEW